MKSKVKYDTLHDITDKPQENVETHPPRGGIHWYSTFSCVRKVIFSHKKMLGQGMCPI